MASRHESHQWGLLATVEIQPGRSPPFIGRPRIRWHLAAASL